MPLSSIFSRRAQKRIAQQRIDSKLDLGRVVDIRKKSFADVKVCLLSHTMFSILTFTLRRNSPTLVRKSVMSDQYHKYDSHRIIKCLPLAVGQAP